MFNWYPGHRTVIGWFIVFCVIVWVARDPARAAADVRGVVGWGQHAVDQIIVFVTDVFSGS